MKKYWVFILLVVLSILSPFVLPSPFAQQATAGLVLFALVNLTALRWGHMTLGQLGPKKRLINICLISSLVGLSGSFFIISDLFLLTTLSWFMLFFAITMAIFGTGIGLMKE